MARTEGLWETFGSGNSIRTTRVGGFDVVINGTNRYLNFNTVAGELGYGFRDNNGVIEVKDSGGSWASISSGGGGGSGTTLTEETPTGTVDGSNTSFSVNNEPLYVIMDGMYRISGQGYSYSGGTITTDLPPTAWIRSYYNA